MTDRILRIAAVIVTLATAVLCVGAIVLRTFWPATPQSFNTGSPLDFAFVAVAAMIYAIVGFVVANRLPRHPVPWLFVAQGVALAGVIFTWAFVIAAVSAVPQLPGAPLAALLNTAVFQPFGLTLTVLLIFLFPDGQTFDRTYRRLALLVPVAAVAFGLGTFVTPGSIGIFTGLENPLPLGLPSAAGRALLVGGLLGMLVLALAGCRSLLLRYRAASAEVREQIRWFAWAASIGIVVFGLVLLLIYVDPAVVSGATGTLLQVLFFTAGALVPIACAIGILRYRLYDIDRLISGTFVYGCLLAVVAGVYSAGMAAFERISVALTGQQSDLSIVLTTLVLAVSLEPMKRRLERFAERFKEAPPTGTAAQPKTTTGSIGPAPVPDNAWIELVAARVVEQLRTNGAKETAVSSTETAEPADPPATVRGR